MSKLRDPIRDAPPLERLVHALHMLETWDLAAPFYRRFSRMQRNSGSKRERFSRLCPCVTRVHENGVWRNLEILAGRIRNSAANRLIGEVVQSRRRPLLGPSPG